MKLKGTRLYSYLSKIKNGFWLPHLIPSQKILENYFKSNKTGHLLKIGSFDGIANDPIYKLFNENKEWEGDFIEPVTYIYDKLVKNLAHVTDRAKFHNCAIGNRNKLQSFYFIKGNESLPNWIEQAGSLNLNMLTRLEPTYPNIKDKIETQNIMTYTFDTFTRKNKINTTDLLHLDTEGYDYIILNSIDLKSWKIPLIMFEHVHMKKTEYRELLKKLSDLNYELSYWEYDTIARKTC